MTTRCGQGRRLRWKSPESSGHFSQTRLCVFLPGKQNTRGTAEITTRASANPPRTERVSCPADEPALCCAFCPAKFVIHGSELLIYYSQKSYGSQCLATQRCVHMLPGAQHKYNINISMLLAPFGPFVFPQHIHAFRILPGQEVNK